MSVGCSNDLSIFACPNEGASIYLIPEYVVDCIAEGGTLLVEEGGIIVSDGLVR
jgi:hypothetical protein